MTVWISVAEAAERLSVTRLTVYNLLTRKKLKGTKLGGFQLVDARSVAKQAGKERAHASR